ncbi:MAG: HAMP domain-containing sensor histidine kinase [Woeseiaceae bacterium]|nr:HAMP domain-containing sensor histidine kinase [Woeseiaceae bacterium]
MLRRLLRSLSFRLLAIFLVLGGLFVYGTYRSIQNFYNSDEIRGLISGHLSLHVQYVRDDIGSPPALENALAITERVPVDIRIEGPDVNWASDPDFPAFADLNFSTSPNFGDDPTGWVDQLGDIEFADTDYHRFLKLRNGDYYIIVSSPRISDVSTQPNLVNQILMRGLAFLLIGYLAVTWLFKPIRDIRVGAAHIGRGNFDHRIERVRGDQLGDLAGDINTLAEDVERMLNAKRALLLGISHELRTPLSRMRLALEFLENEEDQQTLRAEIDEMEKIVVSLLEAERLNVRHAELTRMQVSVKDLVHVMLDDYFSRDSKRIRVDEPEYDQLAEVDDARITLMLKNLLSNALRYSSNNDGAVLLRWIVDGSDLVFTVADDGPGIPPDQAANLGEPFYRPDPSRTRSSGGTGLGLYLATLVANAHGGRLRLIEQDQPGACFQIRIPLA